MKISSLLLQIQTVLKRHIYFHFIKKFCFKTASHFLYLRLTFTSWQSSCSGLASTGITGVHHHAWLRDFSLAEAFAQESWNDGLMSPILLCMVAITVLLSRLGDCMEEMIQSNPCLHPLPGHTLSPWHHFSVFLWDMPPVCKVCLPSLNKLLKAPNHF